MFPYTPAASAVIADLTPNAPSYSGAYDVLLNKYGNWNDEQTRESLQELNYVIEFNERYYTQKMDDCFERCRENNCDDCSHCSEQYYADYDKFISPYRKRQAWLKEMGYTAVQTNLYNLPVQLE